jgi:peroxiredoxin
VGVPDVGGRLPGALDAQLDPAGRQLLAGHGEGWGAPQVLETLRTLVSAGSEPTGGRAPEFSLPTLAGTAVSLEEFRGRTVILNFWWSGCAPCRTEMPALQRFAVQHPGAALLLIDSADSPQAAQAFVRSAGVTAPVLMDSGAAAMVSYHVAYFPTTIVVGPDGVQRFLHAGPVDVSALSLEVSSLS